MAGLGAGLALAFWVGIGSIVTRSSNATLLPSNCRPILLSDNTTTAIQTALSNVTLRYQSHRQHSMLCLCCLRFPKLISSLCSVADPLD